MGDFMLRSALEAGFPWESRFLEGHFPGNPIVPGAIILGHLASLLAREGLGIARVRRMKFVRPLRPETAFEIRVAERARGTQAEFRDGEGVFASATIDLRALS